LPGLTQPVFFLGHRFHHSVSYASVLLHLGCAAHERTHNGKAFLAATGSIPGTQPVELTLLAYPDSPAAKALQAKEPGAILIASGEVVLDDDNDAPIITAAVICDGHADQYLNEVIVVGNLGGEARVAESGKSAKRSVAVNRYVVNPATEERTEKTDWYGCRCFGFNKDKLERIPTGSLVMVAGSFNQLTSSDGDLFCEIKARQVRVLKNRQPADPGAGTTAAGYDQGTFNGSPDDISTDWN